MNLHAPPSTPQHDVRTLRIMLQEKDDIIKNLQKQLGLIKSTLLENTTLMQSMSNELSTVKQDLATTKSDADNWKREAFQSIQSQSLEPADVKDSQLYKDLEAKLQQAKEDTDNMRKVHEEELAQKEKEFEAKLESEIAKVKEQNSELPNEPVVDTKKITELEDKIKKLELQLNQEKEKEVDVENERSTYDKSAIHMLEQQLRRAEDHVMEQSELYQRVVMQLEIEKDRRDKCRKCRKLAKDLKN